MIEDMSDSRAVKLAGLLVDYSVAVKPGDKVVINGGADAAPLVREVYTAVLKAGGHPLLLVSLPGMDEILYRNATDEQLRFVAPPVKAIMETYDASISIGSTDNTRSLSGIDPGKVMLRSQGRREILDIFMARAARGELRWTGTLFPTNAYAQDADMSLSDYEDFVYGACLPDLNDPVGYWRNFSARQQTIIDWLQGKKEVHIKGRDTDLRLSIAGRVFRNCDGHHNMPDGEIFTGPVEDSLEGHVSFSYPAIYQGREVTGIRLEFSKGKVVQARAEKNEGFLLKMVNTDEGSCYAGEFAIGTNEGIGKFTRQILFDEKIAGSFHLALGSGYPETGSLNKSAIHWDMICDLREGGEIRVDGELFYRNGNFVI